MIIGETGTGKELVARCLHEHSARRERHFVAINCGGLPESLLESELFGHEMGAFTTAARRRIGKIEHADGGTLLLDEIESMPLTFQVKLLRMLQAAARHGREPSAASATLSQQLMSHDWPGNVRELRNAAERFVLGLSADSLIAPAAAAPLTLPQQMDQVEKALIEQALKAHRGRM